MFEYCRKGLLLLLLGSGTVAAEPMMPKGDFHQPEIQHSITKVEPHAKANIPPPYDPNQPLTLADLFKVSYRAATQVLQAEVKLEQIKAERQRWQAKDSFQLNLEGRYTWREYQNKTQENPRLVLHGMKRLYDFGRLDQLQQASQIQQKASEQMVWQQRANYRLQLIKAYFDVLLADMQYRVLDEQMAVVYVGLDQSKDRHQVGEISDVDLAKRNYEYQQILVQRNRAEWAQRQKRMVLANLLGFPKSLPDQLKLPDFTLLHKAIVQLPEVDQLIQLGLQRSPELLALQKQVAAQQARVAAAKAQKYPELYAEAWVGALSGHPDLYEGHWRVDIGLVAPLYDAGLRQGRMDKESAGLHQAIAQLQAKEQQLRNRIAERYFQLQVSQAKLKQAQAFGDYAELYLDLSRGLYEWEEKTDLGDAMVRLSQADYQRLQTLLQMALDWTDLMILLGFEPSPQWVTAEMQQLLQMALSEK